MADKEKPVDVVRWEREIRDYVAAVIEARGLTQKQAIEVIGLSDPIIGAIVHRRDKGFSLWTVVTLAGFSGFKSDLPRFLAECRRAADEEEQKRQPAEPTPLADVKEDAARRVVRGAGRKKGKEKKA